MVEAKKLPFLAVGTAKTKIESLGAKERQAFVGERDIPVVFDSKRNSGRW